jgi:hypothetical protein
LILALDRSSSRTTEELAADLEVLSQVIDSLRYGDQVVLLDVYSRGRTGGSRPWVETIQPAAPWDTATARGRRELEDVKRDVKAEAERVVSTRTNRAPGTDLFATFATVSELRQEAGGRSTVLLLFSDMLHVAGSVNMERMERMPPPNWLRQQQEQGILPPLDGICVSAVGPDPLTAHGQAVFKFWQDYFAAAGAFLDRSRYRKIATQADGLVCS